MISFLCFCLLASVALMISANAIDEQALKKYNCGSNSNAPYVYGGSVMNTVNSMKVAVNNCPSGASLTACCSTCGNYLKLMKGWTCCPQTSTGILLKGINGPAC